jgi:electron transfer flavoprotein alpha subunit
LEGDTYAPFGAILAGSSGDLIFAINTDPQAPIFNVAHYGATVDVMDLLPAITEAARNRKEAKSHA